MTSLLKLSTTLIVILLIAASVHAGPGPEPQQLQWGGQAMPEKIPFQPGLLFEELEVVGTNGVRLPSEIDSSLELATMTSDAVPTAEEIDLTTDPQLPPGAREGIFQKLFFTGTWLPQLDGDSLGWGDLETGAVFGFPLFRRDTPLLVTTSFNAHLLDRPDGADIPHQVYDTAFEFRHLRKFGNGPWAMDVAVTLGYYSDFSSSDGDAFRVTGRGVGVYEDANGTKWLLGVGYFNRAGASVLPIAGAIVQHSPDVKWELIFPRPRIAWRLPSAVPGCDERWWYVGGEFSGGIWSIERPISLTRDNITYSDYRLMVGYERKIVGGLSRRYEAGYVMGREFEFDSGAPNIKLDDTIFLRAGLIY